MRHWSIAMALGFALLCGCRATVSNKKQPFFTSGSTEANQRASQYMAKQEQLTGSGEGSDEKGVKKAKPAAAEGPRSTGATNQPAQAQGKLTLYDRLGAEAGISNIVADFLPRAMNDPRINWQRKKPAGTGLFGLFPHQASVMWQATPQNVSVLQEHLVQFMALATGGPTRYTGREIEPAHAAMHISNPEFDATIGDLKASLDKLKIPNLEQKELLSIIETTRPLIVTVR